MKLNIVLKLTALSDPTNEIAAISGWSQMKVTAKINSYMLVCNINSMKNQTKLLLNKKQAR